MYELRYYKQYQYEHHCTRYSFQQSETAAIHVIHYTPVLLLIRMLLHVGAPNMARLRLETPLALAPPGSEL